MEKIQSNNNFDSMLSNIIKLPGIRVNREESLISTYSKFVNRNDIPNLLTKGPIAVGLDKNTVDKVAKKLIDKRTLLSSGTSFMAGLPGGFAMAATIPADILQFFGVAIRLAQELAYLYGFDDIWAGNDDEEIKSQLTLYLGTMFGVNGAGEAIRVISARLSTQALKKLPQQALTKGVIYPIIKSIAKFLGVKMTKDIFAKGVSKAIPLVGGVISGGLTFISMKPMGNRLKETLSKSTFSYSDTDFNKDMDTINRTVEATDVEYENIYTNNELSNKPISENEYDITKPVNTENKSKSLIEMLKETKELLDAGVIDENEFKIIKENLINNNFNSN